MIVTKNDTNSTIVSLCGGDGVGKTTIFNMLKKEFSGPRTHFIKRSSSDIEDLVVRYYPRVYGDERDWVDSNFGNHVAYACALDFVRHYQENISKYLRNENTVVTDRYSCCFIAYAKALKREEKRAIDILEKIPLPNYIIYLHASEKEIQKRIRRRKERINDFENVYCQRRFTKSYTDLFKNIGTEVIEIDNRCPVEKGYQKVRDVFINKISAIANEG